MSKTEVIEHNMEQDKPIRRDLTESMDKHPPPVVATPATLVQMAVEQGANLDKLQQLMDMQDRWERREAEKAYMQAFAAYAANPPEIKKSVYVEHFDGFHADLGEIAKAVSIAMGPHGLSYRWDVEQDGDLIRCRCVISHEQGHSVAGSWQSAMADTTGSKNALQALGSTQTYLKRYTLSAAAGVEAVGMDDDGGGGKGRPEKITDEQALTLESMVTDNGLNKGAILAWIKTTTGEASFASINANQFDKVKGIIEKKITEREPGEDG